MQAADLLAATSFCCASRVSQLCCWCLTQCPQAVADPTAALLLSGGTHLKYLVVSFLPSMTGVLPTLCLMTQLPCTTLGMSLKERCRRCSASRSSPARNLYTSHHIWKKDGQCAAGPLRSNQTKERQLLLCLVVLISLAVIAHLGCALD